MTRKQDQAYAYLRDRIVSGEMMPGQRILPSQVAEALGMSALPVREALLKLQSERLVKTTPHTGSVVALPTTGEMVETLEMLSVLEGYATRHAHPRAADILRRLRSIDRDMKRQLARAAWDRFSRLNRSFHEEIYAACGNESLVATIRSLWVHLDSFMGATSFYLIPSRAAGSLQEHEAIVAMLADPGADPTRLELFAREHGLRTARCLQQMPRATVGL